MYADVQANVQVLQKESDRYDIPVLEVHVHQEEGFCRPGQLMDFLNS